MNPRIADHIKVVLFDHDDTLVGTISTKWAEHKFIAKKYYQKELTDDEIRLHWGKPLAQTGLVSAEEFSRAKAQSIAGIEDLIKA